MAAKKLDKTARKALSTAQEAVDDAKKAVRKLDKSARKKAAKLDNKLAVVKKEARKATKRITKMGAAIDKAERSARASVTTRTATDAVQVVAAEPTGTTATSAMATEPTYRQLRDRAKAQSIPGYSRMDKAALLDALGGH